MSKPIKLIGEPIRSSSERHVLSDWKVAWWTTAAQLMWRNTGARTAMSRVLRDGICDGCSRAVIGAIDHQGHPHRCLPQLERLERNTQSIFSEADVCDIQSLRSRSRHDLRSLGRIGYPFVYRPGDRGLTRTSWKEALDLIGDAVRGVPAPQQMYWAFSENATNEEYYAFAKTARLMGSNNVHLCHSKSGRQGATILEQSLGVRNATVSFSDVLGTDLLLLWGCTYSSPLEDIIRQAQKNGVRVVLLQPRDRKEESLNSLVDEQMEMNAGTEADVVLGVAALLWEWHQYDEEFIRCHTERWELFEQQLTQVSLRRCSAESGVAASQLDWLATLIARARTMVTLYGEVATNNEKVSSATRHLINIHLLKGAIGKPYCGIFPFWQHSGIYGAMDCGIDPEQFTDGRPVTEENAQWLSQIWGGTVSSLPGVSFAEALEQCRAGMVQFLYHSGERLQCVEPSTTLAAVDIRVHQGRVLHPEALVEPGKLLVILPLQSRYEQQGGGTVTSADRRVVFAPSVQGFSPLAESKPAWMVPGLIAAAVQPSLEPVVQFERCEDLRLEMAKVIPEYSSLASLKQAGDNWQWGGAQLCSDGDFSSMPNNRAQFFVAVKGKTDE